MIDIEVINECKKLPFSEVIRRLTEIGIERYYTDLIRLEKTYYSHTGESYIESMPIENKPKVADIFNETSVIKALHSIQKGDIDYPTFIRNIIAAGTVSYTVYIDGKKVVYVGRKGEAYTEKFHF